nr:Chain C, KRAS-G12D-9mer with A18L substitution [Homo sapiens]
GADGVGKSL